MIGLWILGIVLCIYDYKTKQWDAPANPWFKRAWKICVLIGIAGVLYLLFDANVLNHAERYGAAAQFLAFSDSWGNSRGYIWRIALENYAKFSPIHKIFGHGPDTFGLITLFNNADEMANVYHMLFDSAHNEYLQLFITNGPVGLLAYLAIYITAFIKIIKNASQKPAVIAMMYGVICYSIQAIVNIGTPITIPLVLTFLYVALTGCQENIDK